VGARLLDRVGKGLRGAPRDALVADLTPPELRGAAFGLRQSLDTVGAFVGPLLAMALMLLWANDFHAVFWFATLPAFLCLVLLIFGVREPERPAGIARTNPISRANLARLSRSYWWVVALGGALTLARFSEAFLVLRAQQGGLALAWTPVVLVAMNVIYATCAYPFGKLADSVRHSTLLAWGLVLLIGADVLLALSNSGIFFWAGVALWGLHMAMTQGLLAAMVADTAPENLRGTAYGFFNLVCGVAMLVASGLAGWLWDRWGAPHTFMAGICFCLAALVLLWWGPASDGTEPGVMSGAGTP
jgi:MFS family permease